MCETDVVILVSQEETLSFITIVVICLPVLPSIFPGKEKLHILETWIVMLSLIQSNCSKFQTKSQHRYISPHNRLHCYLFTIAPNRIPYFSDAISFESPFQVHSWKALSLNTSCTRKDRKEHNQKLYLLEITKDKKTSKPRISLLIYKSCLFEARCFYEIYYIEFFVFSDVQNPFYMTQWQLKEFWFQNAKCKMNSLWEATQMKKKNDKSHFYSYTFLLRIHSLFPSTF